MFKSNKGFTLVELIVVIAILAILAGIAIPAYSGYITKANDAADTTALASVKTAAMGAWAETTGVDKITVKTDGNGTVTDIMIVDTNGTDVTTDDKTEAVYTSSAFSATENGPDFKLFMNNEMIELKGSYKVGATWTAEGWVAGAIS